MNKRTFWNGIGIGLIVGAVLLQLMLAVSGGTPSASGAEPVKSGTDKLYTEAELQTKLNARLKEELDKRPAATTAPSITPSPAKPKQTVVYITAGLSSDKIVEMLYQSGLVSQPNEFAAELTKRNLNGKIRSGVHLFEGAPDWEAIIGNLSSH
jgi:hypothetical protein